jgi:hypothetical protein
MFLSSDYGPLLVPLLLSLSLLLRKNWLCAYEISKIISSKKKKIEEKE